MERSRSTSAVDVRGHPDTAIQTIRRFPRAVIFFDIQLKAFRQKTPGNLRNGLLGALFEFSPGRFSGGGVVDGGAKFLKLDGTVSDQMPVGFLYAPKSWRTPSQFYDEPLPGKK